MTDLSPEVEMLRAAVSSPAWHVIYHEDELKRAHVKLAAAQALLKFFPHIDPNKLTADDYKDRDDEDYNIDTVDDYVTHIWAEALHDVRWHEQALTKAHKEVGIAKGLLARCGFAELNNYDEIFAAQLKRYNEVRGR
jgi:hypothetical protein